jgi:streptogramin lyase
MQDARVGRGGAYGGMRWLALIGAVAALAMLWASTAQATPLGQIEEFTIPTAESGPNGIAIGPEGYVWFTEFGIAKHGTPCTAPCPSKIGVVKPSKPKEIHDYATPTKEAGPLEIAAGPDGNLWFTEFNVGKIGEINPITHEIDEFTIPAKPVGEKVHPFGITAGREGNVWFTIVNSENGPEESYIGEINTKTHRIKEFPTPTSKSFPAGITSGPEGNLWFAQGEGETAGQRSGSIGEINAETGKTENFEFKTSEGQDPGEITLGHEGKLWFTELFRPPNGAIGAITSQTGEMQPEIPAPTTNGAGATPLGITTGREGDIWFTETVTGRVARLNPKNPTEIIEFPASGEPGLEGPTGITAGREGNLWFAVHGGDKIGRIGTGSEVKANRLSKPRRTRRG